MLPEKEDYAIRILNKVVDRVDITVEQKISLCDEFVKVIREERKTNARVPVSRYEMNMGITQLSINGAKGIGK